MIIFRQNWPVCTIYLSIAAPNNNNISFLAQIIANCGITWDSKSYHVQQMYVLQKKYSWCQYIPSAENRQKPYHKVMERSYCDSEYCNI